MPIAAACWVDVDPRASHTRTQPGLRKRAPLVLILHTVYLIAIKWRSQQDSARCRLRDVWREQDERSLA